MVASAAVFSASSCIRIEIRLGLDDSSLKIEASLVPSTKIACLCSALLRWMCNGLMCKALYSEKSPPIPFCSKYRFICTNRECRCISSSLCKLSTPSSCLVEHRILAVLKFYVGNIFPISYIFYLRIFLSYMD